MCDFCSGLPALQKKWLASTSFEDPDQHERAFRVRSWFAMYLTRFKLLILCQVSMMPEYSGPRLNDLELETDLFEGMTFSKCAFDVKDTKLNHVQVVMSDPKSPTGMQDRGELMKL